MTSAEAAVPAATGPDDATGAAQKVRDALEQELAARNLLMPPPYPATLEVDGESQENPYWKTIEGSTRQALILDVNLDAVDETEVNEDDIRDELTAFLAEYFRWTDVEAVAVAGGVLDFSTIAYLSISSGTTTINYVAEELTDENSCNIWTMNSCMPFNSVICPAVAPPGGYPSIASTAAVLVP